MIILWILLFLLILMISFVLAYSSMKDYQLTPRVHESFNYGLYLIKSPASININFFTNLQSILSKKGAIISFERLFKGQESALVVFGPKEILEPQAEQLSLIELENYTEVNKDFVYAWEVGLKDEKLFLQDQKGDISENFPPLLPHEQFWWQVTLMNKKGDGEVMMTEIRAVFVSDNSQRRKDIGDSLQALNPHLIKLPKDFSSPQMLQFYKRRSFNKEKALPLRFTSIIKLLKL